MRPFRRRGLTFTRQRKTRDIRRALPVFLWFLYIAIVVCLAFFTVRFWGTSMNMVGDSMEGTLSDGEIVLIDLLHYRHSDPECGDIVAILPNGNVKSHYYIRRIVACPGDTVQITDGLLYVNGEVYDVVTQTESIEVAGIAQNEITLGDGEYFLIGDCPNRSEDSRYANIGTIDRSEIYAKVWFCISFGSDFGLVK